MIDKLLHAITHPLGIVLSIAVVVVVVLGSSWGWTQIHRNRQAEEFDRRWSNSLGCELKYDTKLAQELCKVAAD